MAEEWLRSHLMVWHAYITPHSVAQRTKELRTWLVSRVRRDFRSERRAQRTGQSISMLDSKQHDLIHETVCLLDPSSSTMSASKLTKPLYFGKFVVNSSVFHITPLSFAIVNLKPILPGHVLVSPLRIVPRFSDLTPDEVTDLFKTAQKISKTLERVFDATAFNIAIQDGVDAGQSVPHVHAHIIPRKRSDLDHLGGNDKIYDLMDGPEGDVGSHLKQRDEPAARNYRMKVDADEDRKERTEEELKKEAEWLARELEADAANRE
jgi:bis(5'-adenosyl)-triphosphatase